METPQVERELASFTVLGVCVCGRSLSSTLLRVVPNRLLTAQASMVCGSCGRTFTYMAIEHEEPK